ncbi:MAG: radical SAM protein [Candidatus Hodarchaeota archaeon]
MKLKLKEIKAKNIVVKSNLPGISYVVNPYVGCQYGCVYCYADFLRRWTGHGKDSWGKFVDVKVNALDLIEGHAQNYGGKKILFSSVTDPYQPIERRYKLTRQLLEKLADCSPQPAIEILTKSDLITRDIDTLRRFEECNVGFSLCTLDDTIRQVLEPAAPPIAKRINALKNIHEADIETYVFISPIMPYLTVIRPMVMELKQYADFFMFENLNVQPNLWSRIRIALKEIDETFVSKYQDIYFNKEGKKEFWKPIEIDIHTLCAKNGLEPLIFFHY